MQILELSHVVTGGADFLYHCNRFLAKTSQKPLQLFEEVPPKFESLHGCYMNFGHFLFSFLTGLGVIFSSFPGLGTVFIFDDPYSVYYLVVLWSKI